MTGLAIMLLVFVASFAIGYVLISKVPPLLHTPLMSMTNAISAVTIFGALLLFTATASRAVVWLAAIALASAAFNLVGGYVITHRMLRMFRRGGSS